VKRYSQQAVAPGLTDTWLTGTHADSSLALHFVVSAHGQIELALDTLNYRDLARCSQHA